MSTLEIQSGELYWVDTPAGDLQVQVVERSRIADTWICRLLDGTPMMFESHTFVQPAHRTGSRRTS